MVCDTVGRGRNNGSVWNIGNGTLGLGRLEISLGLTIRGVDAGRAHVVTITDLECAILGVVRSIVRTPKTIINVLTKLSLVVAIRVANLQTKGIATHEADGDQDMLTPQ